MARRGSATGWSFASPALLGLLLFLALPFLVALVCSLLRFKIGTPLPIRWLGLENYTRLLSDPVFVRALVNNGVFAAVVVPLQTCLAFGLALCLDQRLPGIVWLRALFFLPVVYPMALVAAIWQLLYAPGPSGPVNNLLITLSGGLWQPAADVGLLQQESTALLAVIALSVWQGLGFQTVILLGGLQAIPRELYEAARVDGASAWQRLWHVTVPQMRNPLIFTVLITAILAFRVFDQVVILTPDGGPDGSTRTLMVAAVEQLDALWIGRASAISVILFGLVLAVTLIQHWLLPQERELA